MVLLVGLASGLGNSIFMLPAIASLARLYRVRLYVETDFPTADLWRRCRYAEDVIEGPADPGEGQPVAGAWRPASWRRWREVRAFPLPYPTAPEWRSNMTLAYTFHYPQTAPPDFADWLEGIDRRPLFDVGMVPGSKGGVWLRKRSPALAAASARLLELGRRVAVFGRDGDGCEEIPGERVRTATAGELADALAHCRVIVGTDSGPLHLASSLGVPVVAVYTATSERKGEPIGRPASIITAPAECRPCQNTAAWHACREWICSEIDAARVTDAAESFLEVPCYQPL